MKTRPQLPLMILLILSFAADNFSAEKQPEAIATPDKGSKSAKPGSKAPPPDRLAWEDALGQVRLLAAKFQRFRDTAVAGKSLARLASIVCQYDKTVAPVFFSQAFDLVQSGLRSSETSSGKELLWGARAVVISSAAQCDPELAERLNQSNSMEDEEKSSPERFWSDLRTAHELLTTNESKSIQFAQAVSQQIPYLQEVQLSIFYGFLWKLQRQSPAAADQLFFQALDQLRQNPDSAIRALGVLGNYVFAPP